MTESHTAKAFGTWNVAQCPFSIEYSTRVLDDIRLSVMDAFFSLPRGGAEIGGVLLGKFGEGRLTISDYVGLDCEHAFGPSFTLSPRDEGRLKELLEAAKAGGSGAPVGWYHSHTRSEIFLSEADLAIHQRYFGESWQVALVLKPHTFLPMRCGFFFRDAQGSMQAASSVQEFSLDPMPMQTVPTGAVPRAAEIVESAGIEAGSVVPVEPAPENGSKIAAEAVAHAVPDGRKQPRIVEPPGFAEASAPSSFQRWLKIVLAAGVGIALGAAGYQERDVWWPRLAGVFNPAGAVVTYAPIGLNTIDTDGQLQIRWDRNSASIRQASGARLSITDTGPNAREIQLDPVRLQSGNFTYAREGESVTVLLTLDEPNGGQTHEVSTFLGKLPAPSGPADILEMRKQRDALTQEAARLRQQLAQEAETNKRLQKALDEARGQLQQQARKRIGNQAAK
jgi:proteasome lid subunit RPN8/RPN11